MLLCTESLRPDACFELIGLSAVSGNVPVQAVVTNIARVLDTVAEQFPAFIRPAIYVGCDRPLIEPHKRATEYHGKSRGELAVTL